MRQATIDDLPALIEMGRKFHAAANLPFPAKRGAVDAALRQMIEQGVIIMSDRGAIGGMLSRAWINPEWVFAAEFFWWAEDGKGRALLRAFEEWARQSGANEVRMTTLDHIPARKILDRLGYACRELSFGKVL